MLEHKCCQEARAKAEIENMKEVTQSSDWGPYKCSMLALWYMRGMGFLQGSEQKGPSVTLTLRRDCAGGFRGHYDHRGEGELRHC